MPAFPAMPECFATTSSIDTIFQKINITVEFHETATVSIPKPHVEIDYGTRMD